MQKEKQIQIPEQLFLDMIKYFLIEVDDETIYKSIKKGLTDKIEALARHELYTKYKTSANEEQREQARQEYLERVGLPKNFRW